MYDEILFAWTERARLYEQGRDLRRSRKTGEPGWELQIRGRALRAEGDRIFTEAVKRVCGQDAGVEWQDDNCRCTVLGVMYFSPDTK